VNKASSDHIRTAVKPIRVARPLVTMVSLR
jgi:hypothetical protein